MEKVDSLFPTGSVSIAPHPTALAATTVATNGNTINTKVTTTSTAPIKETEVDRFNSQHLLLPISNISKIMKASVPLDSKISNSSKILIQSCVSEFISFLTSDANEQVLAERRRTLNGVDLICAVRRLGFEGYYEALQIYLAKYRTVANETGKRHRRPRADDDEDDQENEVGRPTKQTKIGPNHSDSVIQTEEGLDDDHVEEAKNQK
ncbi:hypothetical protein PSHT_06108 [Puccinia striiformis]|uniref:Transcription factor CBF/NF-Y/archaeal histone domain-containing protein n=2 Tax=Puccinia striiformis TaxID=27350 RepID=A0A0L0V4D2_9BASI|nr:hypothetical protein Pst134EB_008281 [Puccinia striiformis f. sp. tritici]KAI9608536.1 hypothetical protein H4Q26_004719 [Puccinia striiformis f. sp. tritici PST-130]KAI9617165.1 hypothetical protein KEM48_004954 [Puccinia striiformis f. sp. tritici PST-130]KNE94031.1 hypothetical protein PSTG_12607 [Puccinia striiformis f. sp. tritici PST-78]POW18150.1 hypothetical protein PSHT_06108 [Puccinia striiformis]